MINRTSHEVDETERNGLLQALLSLTYVYKRDLPLSACGYFSVLFSSSLKAVHDEGTYG